jgi:2-polyprenyl-3-methyl-5-hydroxy-6-metoxy-1,4-benzoquinol methylase
VSGVGQLANFKKNSFDIAFLLHVLEHTNQQELLFREMCNAIKPGGKIYAGPFIDPRLISRVERENKVRFTETRKAELLMKEDGFPYIQTLTYGYFEKRPNEK